MFTITPLVETHQIWISDGASPVFGSNWSGPDAPSRSMSPPEPSVVKAVLVDACVPSVIGVPPSSRPKPCVSSVPVIYGGGPITSGLQMSARGEPPTD